MSSMEIDPPRPTKDVNMEESDEKGESSALVNGKKRFEVKKVF